MKVDLNTTLFLDRDGVINRRPLADYVKRPEQFEFLPGAVDAIRGLRTLFCRIIVVTNQQGIGKGLMTEDDLNAIHQKMLSDIHDAGGRIDAVYYCPMLASQVPNCRKPSPAMALWAQRDFPAIEFENSIMVGDTESDMLFANRLSMKAILVGDETIDLEACEDLRIASLLEFYHFLISG